MPPAPQQPVRLLRAADALDSADLFLRHKTTHRARYDAAWRAAEAQGAFDQIFCNERGELCEGGRSSLLLRLGGAWCTPPLASGLLPGVGRQWLIDHGGCASACSKPMHCCAPSKSPWSIVCVGFWRPRCEAAEISVGAVMALDGAQRSATGAWHHRIMSTLALFGSNATCVCRITPRCTPPRNAMRRWRFS
jgi:Branched-chain amino acid aminotransferase/4-amino-4-deoxychorismate lyase